MIDLLQAHTAVSCAAQTAYREPKHISIIQQVQSEAATEEKTWEERRFEEIYPAWELHTKDSNVFLYHDCVPQAATWCAFIYTRAITF